MFEHENQGFSQQKDGWVFERIFWLLNLKDANFYKIWWYLAFMDDFRPLLSNQSAFLWYLHLFLQIKFRQGRFVKLQQKRNQDSPHQENVKLHHLEHANDTQLFLMGQKEFIFDSKSMVDNLQLLYSSNQ